MPEHFSWIYCVPPFVLLLLTRWGIPVSTTFLTLTLFEPKALSSMLLKSLLGYATLIGSGQSSAETIPSRTGISCLRVPQARGGALEHHYNSSFTLFSGFSCFYNRDGYDAP